ncbi:MAG: DUF1704 domain-containing protein, partial [bacterium]|nr:DUF1704 domain-containing protein [bacterium]
MNKPLIDTAPFERYCELPKLRFSRYVKQDLKPLEGLKRAFMFFGEEPVFSYTAVETFQADHYLQQLETFESVLSDFTNDPRVQLLYAKKIHSAMMRTKLLIAVQRGDDKRTSHYSRELFGNPSQSEADLRAEFDRMLSAAETFHVHTRPVNSALMQQMIDRVLAHYDMQNSWRIKVSHESNRFSLRHGK